MDRGSDPDLFPNDYENYEYSDEARRRPHDDLKNAYMHSRQSMKSWLSN